MYTHPGPDGDAAPGDPLSIAMASADDFEMDGGVFGGKSGAGAGGLGGRTLAFLANPGLNALIIGVLAVGIILALRQVIRLYPEIRWVNNFRLGDPGLAVEQPPTLLAPMAAILGGSRGSGFAMSPQLMRGILDSIATRLDEARDLARYMTGLLVFLGLLGTFWEIGRAHV